ncbi:related to rhodocoxin reductase [Melanopsichium pennsylvanicum]|uniref:Related to rhodocoxin reductase n=2 Tax=Melanopsichium pennsylvanicum TaxID=63383 RepID=A0AAJ4XF63_9BASI|nr:flavo protein [Melanopsichium pennsylvanicum 4]SNX81339.1 related to rhodocoxin reductase [Melanopsichium pennsylvanicum]
MSEQRVRVGAAQDVAKGKMKEFTFAGQGDDAVKVLVSNVKGQLHATSAKCTHYGAPLANGVLTGDGRIICPWHGACFHAKNGEIEDAPALDSILSLKLEVEGDDLYVTADPEKLKGKPGIAPSCKGGVSAITKGKGVVIVGGGAGAINCVEELRKSGYQGSITIISNEQAIIDRTKLSKALIADADKVTWRSKSHLKNVLGVELQHSTVTKVDAQSKSVTLVNGSTVEYDKLVLATGGTPKRIPIPGSDFKNVLVLRQINDTKAINEAVGNEEGDESKKIKNVVIIGSSFIGMEAAIALTKRANVSVVGMEKVPFERVLGEQVGEGLMKAQIKNGLKFHMQAGVERIEGDKSSGPKAVVIKNSQGKEESIAADVVILGVGVAPATGYLKDSGFKLEKDGGVAVDSKYRVEGHQDIFAIGDIAAAPTRASDHGRIEHWNVASNMGRAVAKTLAGIETNFDKVPIFWSALGSQLRYCGSGGPQFDNVYVDGKPEELKFAAYYAKGDQVVAVATMGVDPLMVQSSELIRINAMPKLSEIKNGKNPLDLDLSSISANL